MVDASTSNGGGVEVEQGVLANLPRTRPQRTTARRAAARNNARVTTPARRTRSATFRHRADAPPPAPRPQPPRQATTRTPAPAPARSRQQKAPTQGFECDESSTSSIHPPGGAELVVSAAELVGEMAKAGLSRGERLVRDLFGRLPLS
jgi:hypothetical protein